MIKQILRTLAVLTLCAAAMPALAQNQPAASPGVVTQPLIPSSQGQEVMPVGVNAVDLSAPTQAAPVPPARHAFSPGPSAPPASSSYQAPAGAGYVPPAQVEPQPPLEQSAVQGLTLALKLKELTYLYDAARAVGGSLKVSIVSEGCKVADLVVPLRQQGYFQLAATPDGALAVVSPPDGASSRIAETDAVLQQKEQDIAHLEARRNMLISQIAYLESQRNALASAPAQPAALPPPPPQAAYASQNYQAPPSYSPNQAPPAPAPPAPPASVYTVPASQQNRPPALTVQLDSINPAFPASNYSPARHGIFDNGTVRVDIIPGQTSGGN